VCSHESSPLSDGNPEKNAVRAFLANFGHSEKPLRISITVIHLVLNVEFQIDMLPRLRKTCVKWYDTSASWFSAAELSSRRFR
jgi:hypothetical protein